MLRTLLALLVLFQMAQPSWAGEPVRDCDGCPAMVAIPAGTFLMGSSDEEIAWATKLGAMPERLQQEVPRHGVKVRGFLLAATEVTRDQFEMFVRATRYRLKGPCLVSGATEGWSDKNDWRDPGFPQDGSHPVVCVNWEDANAYIGWLSFKTGKSYRLPSEAEWEYAARANTLTGRYWGWNDADACRFENVGNAPSDGEFPCDDGFAYTAPVGSRQPNPFGLYDMLGNVLEWIEDCSSANYKGAPKDGSAYTEIDCKVRVLRSASWAATPWAVRSAHRGTGGVGGKFAPVGFRVARDE